jgi:hypothetical protein
MQGSDSWGWIADVKPKPRIPPAVPCRQRGESYSKMKAQEKSKHFPIAFSLSNLDGSIPRPDNTLAPACLANPAWSESCDRKKTDNGKHSEVLCHHLLSPAFLIRLCSGACQG